MVPSVIWQLVLPTGMLMAALVPVVPLAGITTVPLYVAVGVAQVTEKLYVPGAPVAGAPVTFLVIVNDAGFAVSGLVIVPVAVPLTGSGVTS